MVTHLCTHLDIWFKNKCILSGNSILAPEGIVVIGIAIVIIFAMYYLIYKELTKEMKEKEASTLFEQGRHTFESNEYKLAHFFFGKAKKRYEEIGNTKKANKCEEYMGKIPEV